MTTASFHPQASSIETLIQIARVQGAKKLGLSESQFKFLIDDAEQGAQSIRELDRRVTERKAKEGGE
jgi:hypothetical protein